MALQDTISPTKAWLYRSVIIRDTILQAGGPEQVFLIDPKHIPILRKEAIRLF